jgi:hypothetical protein
MAVALALMICCPLTDEIKLVGENCQKCPHYVGQIYEGNGIMKMAVMLNCSVIEDAVIKVDNED